MDNVERMEKQDKLARDILILSRNTLLVNLRFLDAALSQFEYVPFEEATFSTDGHYLSYNPLHVLKNYKLEKELPVRDYLHIVFHCIYRHMYIHSLVDHGCWDLACDIAVENVINELGLKATASSRQQRQQTIIDKLKTELNQLTAEKIYRYYLDKQLSPVELANLRGYFYGDNHHIWYMNEDEKIAAMGMPSRKSVLLLGQKNRDNGDSGGQDMHVAGNGEMEQTWKEISERMEMDLETFSKRQGTQAGGLIQNLRAVNREKYDYTAFLKKFAVMGEAMRINDDEFDYVYYTYGLQLYKKMPLIEPLEYKEVKRIKEFVIAIDTSGSTSGELVQRFVQKTYNILKSTESFFSKINLHIIQCDADIQEDRKITCQEDFDEYLKTMQIHGLGGTDFRPVFEYVEELRTQKEFTNLKGLIYFTDGYGTFPERKPDYDTAFVFLDDDCFNPDVPPWAIKLVLQTDEI